MMASQNKEKLNALQPGSCMYDNYMNCFCKDRYFEPLPGFIDIEILTGATADPDTGAAVLGILPAPGKPFAVPTCFLRPCTPGHLEIFQKLQKD
jgi:hypothetical protein